MFFSRPAQFSSKVILILLLALAAPAARAQVAVLTDAWWSNEVDANGDGYMESAMLNWDADAVGGNGILTDVQEEIYYRVTGTGSWTYLKTTGSHMIVGNDPEDAVSTPISISAKNTYDFKIEVYGNAMSPDDTYILAGYKMGTGGGGVNDQVEFYQNNAWWTNEVDSDDDGYKESARLNWDVDVLSGSNTQTVFERLYYRVTGTSTWVWFYDTAEHTITGASSDDAQYMDFSLNQSNILDFKIEVFRSGQAVFDDKLDSTNDPSLSGYRFETNDRITIQNAFWIDETDEDSDEYKESARLGWNVDVLSGGNTQSVFEKIYYRITGTGSWNYLTSHTAHSITGTNTSDAAYLAISNFGANEYDFRIEAYRAGQTTPDVVVDSASDSSLSAYKLEVAAITGDHVTLFDAWWQDEADYNGDGYRRSALLVWNPDVVSGPEFVTVFEKIYRKRSSESMWTLLATKPNHAISGSSLDDYQSILIDGGTHDTWDFKIEIYREGETVPDYQIDTTVDFELDDYRMETAAEDDPNLVVATPTFSPNPAVAYYHLTNVTLACSTPSVVIRYTISTDGSTPPDPDPSSMLYSGTPLTADFGTTRIKAKAWKVGAVAVPSAVGSATYQVNHPVPIPYLVKDISPGNGTSSPSNMIAIGNALYFVADSLQPGTELWRSDGTDAGTSLVRTVLVNSVNHFTDVNGTLFFSGEGNSFQDLWKSDGTNAGTEEITNFPYSFSSSVADLTNVNGTLYFTVNDGSAGNELWKSNGTLAGTVLVKDITPGDPLNSSNPYALTNLSGTLFFAANAFNSSGAELWKSNGTASGTTLVKDIFPGYHYYPEFDFYEYFSSYPNNLTAVNGVLFCSADNGTNGIELWKSNGSGSGTILVKDINPGFNSSSPENLVDVNGTLFFRANDGSTGEELWKSDGTLSGTVLVKDIASGSTGSSPQNLTNVNGTLFFTAGDGVNGIELWKSDGTLAGTVMVKDINPGSANSTPQYLINVNGDLFFAANDGTHGNELWASDGTASGTVLIKDIRAGAAGSDPASLTNSPANVNGTLFFTADEGINGRELWALNTIGDEPVVNPINDATIPISQPYYGPAPVLTDGSAPVIWTLIAGPSGMTINSQTGVVAWPAPADGGSPITITIKAANGFGEALVSWTITVDTSLPEIYAINRMDPNPPSTGSVRYAVTFSEPVTGVDVDDFYFDTGGSMSGEEITEITGGPTVYTVTVNTGTGSGWLRLCVSDADGDVSIRDVFGNALEYGFTGQIYMIDHTAPGFTGLGAAPSPACQGTVVTISFTAGETLQTSPTVTVNSNPASINTHSGLNYTARYTILAADPDGPANVVIAGTDLVGNPGSTASTSILSVDKTAPAPPASLALAAGDDSGVSASDRITNHATGLTIHGTAETSSVVTLWKGTTRLISGTAADFASPGLDINLSEGVHGITATAADPAGNVSAASAVLGVRVDIAAPIPGTAASPAYAKSAPIRVTYTGAADGGGGLGHVELWVKAGGGWQNSGLRSAGASGAFDYTPAADAALAFALVAEDLAGNRSGTPTGAGDSQTSYDTTPPQALSINRLDTTPTSASAVSFTVTFNEPVSGVDTGDFSFFTNGSLSGAQVVAVTGGPSVYTATISTGEGDGMLRMDLSASGTGIQDQAGNAAGGFSGGQSYRVDRVAPGFLGLGAAPANARLGALVTLSFTVSEALPTSPTLTVNDNNAPITAHTGLGYSCQYTIQASDPEGPAFVAVSGADALGNTGGITSTYILDIDKTAPSPPAMVLDTADDSGVSNADGITNRSAGLTLRGLADADTVVQLWDGPVRLTSGTAAAFDSPGLDVGLTAGSHSLTAVAVDTAGNESFASAPVVILVDVTAPTPGTAGAPATASASPIRVTASGGSDTGSGMRRLELWYKKDAGNWQDSGLRVAGASGGFDFAPAGSGVYAFAVRAEDLAGNGSPAPSGTGDCLTTFDATAPQALAISRLDPTPTSSTTVRFAVVFGEPVSGVDASDFSLNTDGTLSGMQVTGVIGGPVTYIVNVQTSSGDGNLRLDLNAAGTGIKDALGNDQAAGFSAGQSYRVDHTPPAFIGLVAVPGAARLGNDVMLSFTASEALQSSPTLTVNGNGIIIKTHTGLNYTYQYPIRITDPDGPVAVVVTGVDRTGNTGMTSSNSVLTIDKSTPPTPVGLGMDAADDSGVSSSDRITNHTSGLTVHGTAEAGARVKLWKGTTFLTSGTAAAFQSPGLSFSLAPGAHIVTATATDAAGNVSPASAGLGIRVDTTAPVLSGLSATPGTAGLGVGVAIGFTASEALGTSPTVTVNTRAAALTGHAGLAYTATYKPQAADSEGAVIVAVSGADVAGNPGSVSSGTILRIDKTAPASYVRITSGLTGPRLLTIRWTSNDPTSGGFSTGVKSVDVYWSRNGSAPQKLGNYAPGVTSADFNLATHGSYGWFSFYTVALDGAGNVEAAPAAADWGYQWTDPAAAAGPGWRDYK